MSDPILVEAESLALSALYRLETNAAASGGQLIRLAFNGEGGSPGSQGTATLASFTGASGSYDLAVAYFNENDGASTFEVLVNGTLVGSWVASAPSSSSGVSAGNRVTQTLTGLTLNTGDQVAVRGTRNGEEYARVDTLTFTPAGQPPLATFVFEAEDLALSALYRLEARAVASGGELIRLAFNGEGGSPGSQGTATIQDFAGPAGTYAIDVAYFNENDGASTFEVLVNGTVVGSWVADAPSSSSGVAADNRVVQTLTGIALAPGDDIAIRGTRNGEEYARVDTLTLRQTAGSGGNNPVGAVSDINGAANSVPENAATGTPVGLTARATDPDATDSVSYTLTNTAGGRFAIGGTTGIVTVADGTLLDFETATSHQITVRADSTDGTFSTQAFTIAVADVNEGSPTTVVVEAESLALSALYRLETNAAASGGQLIRLAFNGEGGSPGSQGTATLASFTGASGSYDLAVAYFNENDGASTFEVLVNGTLVGSWVADAPSSSSGVSPGNRVTQTLTGLTLDTGDQVAVRGTRNGEEYARVDTLTFTPVTGGGNNPVGAVSDINGTANSVPENAATGTPVGLTARATDPDPTDSVSYTLTNTAGGRFAINGTTGIVTGADGTLLDFETATSHQITVRADSTDGTFSTQGFTIAVADVNEGSPTTIIVEAEDLALSALYRIEARPVASGGELIRLAFNGEGGSPGSQATATLQDFAGAAGTYDIAVAYFNENDGASTFEVLVNGSVVGSWVANAPSSSSGVAADNRVIETIEDITLSPGDDIAIRGTRNGEEYARVDTVILSPAGVFTPGSLRGLEVWLDGADASSMTLAGSDVGTWLDKSGNGHHHTQGSTGARPDLVTNLQNGLSGVRFDGVDDFLTGNVDDLSLAGSTVFVVGRFSDAVTGSGILSFANTALATDTAQEDGFALTQGPVGTLAFARDSGGGNPLALTGLSAGATASIVNVTFAAGTALAEIDGDTPSGDSYGNTATIDPTQSLLGARWQSNAVASGLFGESDLFEVLIYDRALAQDEIDAVLAYLDEKWGISTGASDTDFQFVPFAGQSNAVRHFTDFGGIGSQRFLADYDALSDADAVSVINVALGASAVDRLAAPSTDPTRYWWDIEADAPGPLLVSAINAILASGRTPTGIVWAQGEQDAASLAGDGGTVGLTTIARYKQATEAVFDYFRDALDDPTLPFYIQQIGPHATAVRQLTHGQIREAQQELADTLAHVDIAAATYDLALADSVHFTSAGYEAAAARLTRFIAFDQGRPSVTYGESPVVQAASLSGGNQVLVTLDHGGGTDVTPATNIAGFWVEDGGSAVAVTAAQRVSGNQIALTLASAVSASAELHYINGLSSWNTANILLDNASPLALPLLPYDGTLIA